MKKTFVIIIGTILFVFSMFFIFSLFNQHDYSDIFAVDAIYYEDGYVEVVFNDNTKKSNLVILEILGMKESYQKKFLSNSFVERIDFSSVPKYGWKSTPVTFVVDHGDFGKIGIKTEIADNPFPDDPPNFIRVEFYRYEFLEPGSEAIWKRTYLGSWLPPLSKDTPELKEFIVANGWEMFE